MFWCSLARCAQVWINASGIYVGTWWGKLKISTNWRCRGMHNCAHGYVWLYLIWRKLSLLMHSCSLKHAWLYTKTCMVVHPESTFKGKLFLGQFRGSYLRRILGNFKRRILEENTTEKHTKNLRRSNKIQESEDWRYNIQD